MTDLLLQGGLYFMIPLTILAATILALIGRSVMLLMAGKSHEAARALHLLFHVGLLSFVFGLLSHAISLYQMVGAIESAGGVSPALVAGGLRVSFIAPLFGLCQLAVSMFVWILLRTWRDRLEAAAS